MAIALDTSVVVRLLVGAPVDEFAVARDWLRDAHSSGEMVLVSDLVIVEAYHALRHHYRVPDADVLSSLAVFLNSGLVQSDPERIAEVLADSRRSPGLVDRLIHRRSLLRGATLVTLDRRQARLEGADLLK
jgi:predicted nucleic acid-binding protein